MPQSAQAAQPAAADDEGMYEALRDLAKRHGMLDAAGEFDKRLRTYRDEGVLDFLKTARSGAPDSEALAAFNRRGRVKLSGLQRVDENEYAGTTTDGRSVRLNLDSMTAALLPPKEQIAHLDKSAKNAADIDRKRMEVEAKDRESAARAGEREARAKLAEANAVLAAARAGAVGKPKPVNWNSYAGQLRGLARDRLTTTDSLGKKKVDHQAIASVVSMATALAQRDPETYMGNPGLALEDAMDRMEEIKRNATVKAEREVTSFERSGGSVAKSYKKGREERVAERAAEIAAAEVRAGRGGAQPSAGATKPSEVSRPQTQADFDSLPSGALYIDPDDGKTYRKP